MTSMDGQGSMDPRVLRLSRDFDSMFSGTVPPVPAAGGMFLALRVGGDPYALAMAEISGLSRGRRIAALPHAPQGLRGLCGLRGTLLPVWDLAVLLGYAGEAAPWQVQASDTVPWALAFGHFEGTLNLPLESLRSYAGQGPAAAFSVQAIQEKVRIRPILDLALLSANIRLKIPPASPRSFDEKD
jgi:hypothetical protein